MSVMEITVDDSPPKVAFVGSGWSADTRADGGTPSYFQQSFHATTGEGDRMRYRFNGSSVHVYGSRWYNHGAFTVRVDDGIEGTFSSNSPTREFQSLLYTAGGLDLGMEHVIEVINRPSRTGGPPNSSWWLDIDYLVIGVPADAALRTVTIDDTSPAITYSSGWSARPDAGMGYHNVTAHRTTTDRSQMELIFRGSSIQLMGTLCPQCGDFAITIDGNRLAGTYNATWHVVKQNSLLFALSGLSDTTHNITVMNVINVPSRNTIEFDYAIVNSTVVNTGGSPGPGSSSSGGAGGFPMSDTIPLSSSPASPSASTSSGQDTSRTKEPSVPVGGIAGGIAGGLVILALLGAFIWWRRKKAAKRAERSNVGLIDLTGDEVKPYSPYSPYPPGSGVGGYGQGGNEDVYYLDDHEHGPTPNTPSKDSTGWMPQPIMRASERGSAFYPGSGSGSTGYETSQLIPPSGPGVPRLTNIPPPPGSDATSYPASSFGGMTFGGPNSAAGHQRGHGHGHGHGTGPGESMGRRGDSSFYTAGSVSQGGAENRSGAGGSGSVFGVGGAGESVGTRAGQSVYGGTFGPGDEYMEDTESVHGRPSAAIAAQPALTGSFPRDIKTRPNHIRDQPRSPMPGAGADSTDERDGDVDGARRNSMSMGTGTRTVSDSSADGLLDAPPEYVESVRGSRIGRCGDAVIGLVKG